MSLAHLVSIEIHWSLLNWAEVLRHTKGFGWKLSGWHKMMLVSLEFEGLTLSLSFSFSLSMDLFRPSSRRSINRTVSPERVLNFFLRWKFHVYKKIIMEMWKVLFKCIIHYSIFLLQLKLMLHEPLALQLTPILMINRSIISLINRTLNILLATLPWFRLQTMLWFKI